MRILVVAAEVFAEQGTGASLNEIARRAGVGPGTLYRNFANKRELIAAIVESIFERFLAAGERALHDDDPWRGLVGFLELIVGEGVEHRLIRDLVVVGGFAPRELRAGNVAFLRQLRRLAARARDAGMLRDDVTAEDLVLLLTAMARVVDLTADVAPDQWKRQLALLLRGLRSGEGADELSVPAITPTAIERGTMQWSQQMQNAPLNDPGGI